MADIHTVLAILSYKHRPENGRVEESISTRPLQGLSNFQVGGMPSRPGGCVIDQKEKVLLIG